MTKLPYIQPERELHYNVGIVLLVLHILAQTKNQKKVLTIDKIQSFCFLATRPTLLNRVLRLANKKETHIDESDYYTIETLSPNTEELYDRERLLIIMKILASKEFLLVDYSNTDGFLFDLTATGKAKAKQLNDGYFQKIRSFTELLSALQSQSPTKLNGYIISALKQEA